MSAIPCVRCGAPAARGEGEMPAPRCCRCLKSLNGWSLPDPPPEGPLVPFEEGPEQEGGRMDRRRSDARSLRARRVWGGLHESDWG